MWICWQDPAAGWKDRACPSLCESTERTYLHSTNSFCTRCARKVPTPPARSPGSYTYNMRAGFHKISKRKKILLRSWKKRICNKETNIGTNLLNSNKNFNLQLRCRDCLWVHWFSSPSSLLSPSFVWFQQLFRIWIECNRGHLSCFGSLCEANWSHCGAWSGLFPVRQESPPTPWPSS